MGRQMRLDQYISTYVELTRKEAKEAIRRGLVCVAGTVVKQANCKIDSEEDVTYCGKEIRAEEFVYYMLNKPAGVVSATKDEKERTVLSLLPEMKRELFPMGRLDKDTVGLLILTDDGMLAHELLSPKKHVDKVYFAKVAGRFTEEEIKRFREGLDIGNGEKAKEAFLEILKVGEDQSEVLITITEGKFHQVKRMAKAVGSEVLYLKRLSMGPLKLDEELEIGTYRRLSAEELHKLKEHTDVRK